MCPEAWEATTAQLPLPPAALGAPAQLPQRQECPPRPCSGLPYASANTRKAWTRCLKKLVTMVETVSFRQTRRLVSSPRGFVADLKPRRPRR